MSRWNRNELQTSTSLGKRLFIEIYPKPTQGDIVSNTYFISVNSCASRAEITSQVDLHEGLALRGWNVPMPGPITTLASIGRQVYVTTVPKMLWKVENAKFTFPLNQFNFIFVNYFSGVWITNRGRSIIINNNQSLWTTAGVTFTPFL